VSWLGEIIGFRQNDEEPSLQRTVFDFAIVPDPVFCADAKCPHCGTYAQPELIEAVEDASFKILGDLMICSDCQMLYLVVEIPILDITEPVMTRWSVPEKIYQKVSQKLGKGYFQNGQWHEL
jgi:hypothetical protein